MGYRSINQAYEIIKQNDSGTQITPYLLRMLCKNGVIKVLQVNKKFLINMDDLCKFLEISIEEKEGD